MNVTDILEETVDKLAHPDSYDLVYVPKHERPIPSNEILANIVDLLRGILFPGYYGNSCFNTKTLQYHIGVNVDRVYNLLSDQIQNGICFACRTKSFEECNKCEEESPKIAAEFLSKLPEIRRILSTDVKAAYNGDPAATSMSEIIYCYPTVRALSNHRIAHELLKLEIPLLPRIISEMAHSETGIDIHPRAKIGESCAIDHGTGLVIGATCIIGNNVKIYQGVTLGAKSFPLDEEGNPIKGIPRHPIVEDDVVIYAGATILGRITIGKGSVIGGNVWITNDVPPKSKILQVKAREMMFENGGGI